ncbi:MAG TPA: chemotaxis protein CheX [Paraburkholderia sp.]|jgi:CheY-specific phosphatase CheX|nr:chemotaxis protein CheX [Paraburkholderia sp.]
MTSPVVGEVGEVSEVGLVSKMLVLGARDEQLPLLARVCDEHNVIGVVVRHEDLPSALAEHTDLGAVLLAGDYDGSPAANDAIGAKLHALRPELPVILQLTDRRQHAALPRVLATCVTDTPESLGSALDEHVFGVTLPDALVAGIVEITTARLRSLFPTLEIDVAPPSVVRDRIIFGDAFSLIPLEGAWCRGYMLMQAEEEPVIAALDSMTEGDGRTADFRELNSVLGELTNLVWGAFKNRFLNGPAVPAQPLVQVPLLINHRHRYISFGSDNPQLCFRYRLAGPGVERDVVIDQRFVFSLNWSPEDFDDSGEPGDSTVCGEIDFF